MNTQQLETSLNEMLDKEPVSFEQKELDFGMSIKTLGINKDTLYLALGSAVSGTVSGLIASVIPVGSLQGIAGLPQIVAGVILRGFIFKTGATAQIANGVLVAGIANAISGFIPQFAQLTDGIGFKQTEKEIPKPQASTMIEGVRL